MSSVHLPGLRAKGKEQSPLARAKTHALGEAQAVITDEGRQKPVRSFCIFIPFDSFQSMLMNFLVAM